MSYDIQVGRAERIPFPDKHFDIVFSSPPYMTARTYGRKGIARKCVDWVEWMLDVTDEALRVCKGPVIWVASSCTRKRNYQPACEGLMWEWYKRGGECHAYSPVYWNRCGISGGGGDQWFRPDVEICMCFKRPGPLPFMNNTAMGHPPKWAPGGEMSHRISDGKRVNQRGGTAKSGRVRKANGGYQEPGRPSHKMHTKRKSDGTMGNQCYTPPAIVNPGNVIKNIKVGGGRMGSPLAHENEAPFPEKLAEWWLLSTTRPGDTVLDPFCGSGTTIAVAHRLRRNAIGIDLRESQVELAKRRCSMATPNLEFMEAK